MRYELLESLSTRPKTVRELTNELKMHRLTVRYHLGFLLREGLVREVRTPREGKTGRPPARYQTARHARVPGFPPRHFEIIAHAALTSLLEALGEGGARRRLYAKGKELGKGLIAGVTSSKGVKKWSPASFEAQILQGAFRNFGVSSEVLAKSDKAIHYRSFGCPFLELAEQMPDVVCDALDWGFHDGIDEALGPARTERLRCMGHGDPFCEYTVTWGAGAKSAGPRG